MTDNSAGEILFTAKDKEVFAAQLSRILTSPYFSQGERCSVLLRHVVTETLEGRSDDLQERNLGVALFYRSADFDIYSDPIVRITAVELRRRLSQYYLDPEHAGEPHITLPPASFVPMFSPGDGRAKTHAAEIETPSLTRRSEWASFASGACIVLIIVGIYFGAQYWRQRQPAVEAFWGAFSRASTPVNLCIGQPDHYYLGNDRACRDEADKVNRLGFYTMNHDNVVLGDVVAAANVINILGRQHVGYNLIGANNATFAEMQRAPVVLIAAADNPWTTRLSENLRFRVMIGDGHVNYIGDVKNPMQRDWAVDFKQPYSDHTQDYGLVGRFYDTTTGQMAVIVGGVGVNGTLCASQLVSDPTRLEQLFAQLPAEARRKNLEVVIGTQPLGDRQAPPKLLAYEIW